MKLSDLRKLTTQMVPNTTEIEVEVKIPPSEVMSQVDAPKATWVLTDAKFEFDDHGAATLVLTTEVESE